MREVDESTPFLERAAVAEGPVDVLCICQSVYGSALTRGKVYSANRVDLEHRQYRVRGDNGRSAWFPWYCFASPGTELPELVRYSIDDPIEDGDDVIVEVTVELSTGERRWCRFSTPDALTDSGWVLGDTDVHFHYGNRHLIVVSRLSHDVIAAALKWLDVQDDLVDCTIPLE